MAASPRAGARIWDAKKLGLDFIVLITTGMLLDLRNVIPIKLFFVRLGVSKNWKARTAVQMEVFCKMFATFRGRRSRSLQSARQGLDGCIESCLICVARQLRVVSFNEIDLLGILST